MEDLIEFGVEWLRGLIETTRFEYIGIEQYISGVILFEETWTDVTDDEGHKRFVDILQERGILVGIQVDQV